MSGYRVGALYTHNMNVYGAMKAVSGMTSISNEVQSVLATLFADDGYIDTFIQDSCHLLSRNRDAICQTLTSLGIPFIRPSAAMFLWFDLREVISSSPSSSASASSSTPSAVSITFEEERETYKDLFHNHRIMLSPGECFFSKEPGFFRICFGTTTFDDLHVGLQRFSQWVKERRKSRKTDS